MDNLMSVTQTMEIACELPTYNQLHAMNHFKYNRTKKELQYAIGCRAKRVLSPVRFYPVKIDFLWVRKSAKADLDNISSGGRKIIIDALVDAGILQGDGRKHIASLSDVAYEVDTDNPSVRLWIHETKGD